MTDLMAALVAFVGADAVVAPLVTSGGTIHVYGLELPESVAPSMPRQAVVLSFAGGAGLGARSYLELAETRTDAFCYGASAFKAYELQRAVHDALKGVASVTQGDTVIKTVMIDSGPRFLRDPDTNWPVVVESYNVIAAECAAA